MPLAQVTALSEPALIAEAGQVWGEWVRDRAQAVRHLPDKDRKAEVRRLARSDDEDDRHVAALVERWSKS